MPERHAQNSKITHALFLKCEDDECMAEFNTVNFFGEICDTECIELCSDLYNIAKNDICVGALKRDEFAATAICGIFIVAVVVVII